MGALYGNHRTKTPSWFPLDQKKLLRHILKERVCRYEVQGCKPHLKIIKNQRCMKTVLDCPPPWLINVTLTTPAKFMR